MQQNSWFWYFSSLVKFLSSTLTMILRFQDSTMKCGRHVDFAERYTHNLVKAIISQIYNFILDLIPVFILPLNCQSYCRVHHFCFCFIISTHSRLNGLTRKEILAPFHLNLRFKKPSDSTKQIRKPNWQFMVRIWKKLFWLSFVEKYKI